MTEKNDWTKDELIKEVSSHTAVTIPVNMCIEAQQRILDLSEMERLLKDAKLIAIGECYCRKKYQKCDGPIDVCLNLDKEAEDFIARARDVAGRDARKSPTIVDADPSSITLEGPEQLLDKWSRVNRPTPSSSRVVYPGAGSELFHGKKKK